MSQPKAHKMNKKSRLQSAQHWLTKYTGTKIISGYRKKYGVSSLCAALELKILGWNITEEQIAALKKEEQTKCKKTLLRKKKKEEEIESIIEQDEYFYFIAGYTSGGAPYGITWEEAKNSNLID